MKAANTLAKCNRVTCSNWLLFHVFSICQMLVNFSVFTPFDSFSCRPEKLSGLVCTATARSRHTWIIVPARLAEMVWCTKFHPHSWIWMIFTSVLVGSSPRSYWFTSAIRSKYLFILYRSVAQNLSDVWRSTLEIGTAQLRRNRAESTVLICESFSCRHKSYLVQWPPRSNV